MEVASEGADELLGPDAGRDVVDRDRNPESPPHPIFRRRPKVSRSLRRRIAARARAFR